MSAVKMLLHEEPVSPTGGPKAEGAKRVLGTPSMGSLTVVLREAVQNSWDARVGDEVRFAIHYYKPNAEQKRVLLERMFAVQPSAAQIRERIAREDFAVLVFSDRGTTGLNGPIAANIPTISPGQRRNFVDFMFEIGRDSAKGIAGGTYGFGKSSFFLLSRVSTVCVHTRCLSDGDFQERLMVAHLGISSPGRTTGRAWWGKPGRPHPEPLIDAAATELAGEVGLPAFSDNDLGTSIMVLAPRLTSEGANNPAGEQATAREVIASLGTSIVQWFWPKMMPTATGRPAIAFSITHGGTEVRVPAPADQAPYCFFAEALAALEAFKRTGAKPPAGDVRVIASQSPNATLGHLCLLRRPKGTRIQVPGDFEEESAKELADQSHHVALLRAPRLVVKYLAGPKPPSEALDVAGVFLVDELSNGGEVENAFALSEPPVHDDWVSAALESRTHKVYVNGALKRIKESIGDFVLPHTDSSSSETPQPGLGAFSEMMGGLLAATTGTSARANPPSPGGGGGGGGNPGRVRLLVAEGRLENHATFGVVLAVPFTIENAGKTPPTVTAAASVVLDGSTERDPPNGAEAPMIRAFERRQADGKLLESRDGTTMVFAVPGAGETWHALASIPPDARVRLSLSVQE